MTSLSIANEWRSCFGSALPAGFLCRAELGDRWLRIHSLPQSKRYAGTEAERRELLARQLAAAAYVLGEGSSCTLFITRFGNNKRWSSSEDLPLGGGTPEHVMSFHEGEDEIQFFALRVTWTKGAFDELVMAAAEEKTGPILFANMANRSAYAPYDGGADLFFPSPAAARTAREHFADWVSKREDGL